jgi:hypothetical protein
MRKSSLLLLAVLLGCSTNRPIPCPDGHTATIERCEPARLVSRRVILAADVNLEYAGEKLADANVGLATDVERVANIITNRTVQLQSILHSLCQQRNTSPCNEAFQERLTSTIERVNRDILTIKEQTEEVRILADQAVAESEATKRNETLGNMAEILEQVSTDIEKTVEAASQGENLPPSNQ